MARVSTGQPVPANEKRHRSNIPALHPHTLCNTCQRPEARCPGKLLYQDNISLTALLSYKLMTVSSSKPIRRGVPAAFFCALTVKRNSLFTTARSKLANYLQSTVARPLASLRRSWICTATRGPGKRDSCGGSLTKKKKKRGRAP